MIHEKFKNNMDRSLLGLEIAASPTALRNDMAVAVSGGIDSMVLLSIISKYASEHNISLHILTVNHNLRENSRQDAEFVMQHASNHICKILTWEHGGISANIQAKAREARYKLLTDYCKKHGINTLFTAHHADDQLENFFIKLSRGASIYSLASNKVGIHSGIKILRPFDGIFKSEIEEYAAIHEIPFVEDESNSDVKYLRNEMRKKLKVFFAHSEHLPEDLFKNRFLLTIDNITRATKSLECLIDECLKKSFEISECKAVLYLHQYKCFMQEEQMQALVKILQLISGNSANIRMNSLTKLYEEIIGEVDISLTLHGCIIQKSGDLVVIKQETGREA
jgi:tRNA(Ile)-lysidine synthase